MIETIKVAYQSPDLEGDFLVRPLRTWNNFLATKIEKGSDLASLAWKVGYILDVPLGLIALIGIIIKSFQVSGLKKNNTKLIQELRSELTSLWESIRATQGRFEGRSHSGFHTAGYQPTIQREFIVKESNVDAIYVEIESFVKQSVRRLLVDQRVDQKKAEIVVSFSALDPTL
jgi:hypothetical protein